MKSLCGIECDECQFKEKCQGCKATCGKPFGGECAAARCILKGGKEELDKLKQKLIGEFRELGIKELEKLDNLVELAGFYVNLEYPLANGTKVKLLDDNRIYFGYQIEKEGSERCYGLVADEDMLLVSEYGCEGKDPELIVYRKLD